MIFLNPGWLWLFAALPLVAAIYLLKVKPKLKATSTMFLWDKIFLEKRSSALFRKLKDILSLLLMLLAACLIILALSKPVISGSVKEKLLVIVIDNSVGMNARSNNKSFLDTAKNAAKKIVNETGADQSAVIASLSDELRILVGSTENKRRLLNGIDKVAPSYFPMSVNAFSALDDIAKEFKNSRLIIISDCSFPGTPPQNTFLVKVGEDAGNAGICSLDMIYLPEAKTLKVYCRVCSSFSKNIKSDLIVSYASEDNIKKVYPLKISPGLNKAAIFEIRKALPGKWIVELDIKDSMEADNKAYAFLSAPRQIKVSLGTNSRNFYRYFVESFKQADNGFTLAAPGEKSDIAIVEGSEKNAPDSDSLIILNPSGESIFWKALKNVEISSVSPQKNLPEHPAVKFCNLENIDFSGSKSIMPPENSVIIAKNLDGIPLVYKTEVSGKKAYVVNLNTRESDFYLNVSFPVMLRSMALDLAGIGRKEKAARSVADLSRIKNDLVNQAGAFTGKPGFYKNKNPKDKTIYPCSILNESESLSKKTDPGKSALKIEAGMPISDLLYILAAIILTLECILYHRRKVG